MAIDLPSLELILFCVCIRTSGLAIFFYTVLLKLILAEASDLFIIAPLYQACYFSLTVYSKQQSEAVLNFVLVFY